MPELLYSIKARFVKIEDIGAVPEGGRKNFHFAAEISGEEIQGNLRGIDYALTTASGIQAHIHEVLTTQQGEKISLERSGHTVSHQDAEILVLEGQGQARTASERLAWLNDTVLFWRAQFPPNSNEFTAEVYRE